MQWQCDACEQLFLSEFPPEKCPFGCGDATEAFRQKSEMAPTTKTKEDNEMPDKTLSLTVAQEKSIKTILNEYVGKHAGQAVDDIPTGDLLRVYHARRILDNLGKNEGENASN